MTANTDDYGRLLAEVLPHVLEDEREYQETLDRVRLLMIKGEMRSAAEDRLLGLLAALVERYEAERFRIPDAEPAEVLAFLIEDRGLKPADLADVLGSRGHVSDVLSGRRRISADKARALAAFFGVDAGVFV